jgi:hypothetical protein
MSYYCEKCKQQREQGCFGPRCPGIPKHANTDALPPPDRTMWQYGKQRIMAEVAYPHHCAPEDVEALARRLEALADPEQEACPAYEHTDWRTTAGVCARVIKYLAGHDWRHGA